MSEKKNSILPKRFKEEVATEIARDVLVGEIAEEVANEEAKKVAQKADGLPATIILKEAYIHPKTPQCKGCPHPEGRYVHPTEPVCIIPRYEHPEQKLCRHDHSDESINPLYCTLRTASSSIDHGSVSGLGDDDHTQYYNETRHTKALHDALSLSHDSLSDVSADDHHARQHALGSASDHTGSGKIKTTISFAVVGDLATGNDKAPTILSPCSLTITKVKVVVKTAPTGSSIIVDVNKDGTTIFTTQGNRPEIAIGEYTDDSGTPDVTALVEGSKVTVDIDQVGSTVAGADLTVEVVCEQSVVFS